jgi:DNA polymerase-3 subunit delta'
MSGFRTRGQPAAALAIGSMIRGPAPHAVVLVGPAGVGKTTLAEDLAAGLLCVAADPAERPCRTCRACRMVAHGNHPDLHRLAPSGAGGQIVIGGRSGQTRGVRDLVADLSLLPVEGGARVAIVEAAHRMNEDAQSAFLKTLEEPPAGVTLVLCADDEDRLLETVRSRCQRVRLGPVPVREVEAILAELGVADPPEAARLARLTGGRPGLAVAYARAPEAAAARHRVALELLDLTAQPPARRLGAIRELLAAAGEARRSLDQAETAAAPAAVGRPPRGPAGARGRGRRGGSATAPADDDDDGAGADSATSTADAAPVAESSGNGDAAVRTPAAERRRAAGWLLDAWRDLARDLAVSAAGDARSVRDPTIAEELAAVGPNLEAGAAAAFLARLADLGEGLDSNVSPELLLDVLVLAWPARRAEAA